MTPFYFLNFDASRATRATRTLFRALLLAVGGVFPLTSAEEPPNLVILFADDMGYGDPGCYGHPLIRTPQLDRLASQGMRLTSFVTGSWCVPSRTQLITGRYMPRVDFKGHTGADGRGGLPDSEKTLPEALKEAGYATHMVGKWHLGYKEKRFLPVNQGFDTWFGLPYSNDYIKPWVQTDEPLGLYRDEEMVEHPFDQDPLTTRYTEEAVEIIEKAEGPFFLYLAYAMPHLPLHVSDERRGKSQAGLYGDVIEEVDWSVGEVLAALDKKGVADNTLVFFASDNGPWIDMPERMLRTQNKPWHAGSTGPLRGSKGQTYEGGPRVPAILRWPGKIEAGRVEGDLVGMPDIYRTFIAAGGGTPPEHVIDGHDLTPFLSGGAEASPREDYYYFRSGLEAVRVGRWKLRTTTGEPELFDMIIDPYERVNRAVQMPKKVAELRERMKKMAEEVGVKVAGE